MLKEASPIISFNWGRFVLSFYTLMPFCLMLTEWEVVFFLNLSFPSFFLEKSYKLRQKIITWRNKTCRFPRHLKLMSCRAQNIPCPCLYRLFPISPSPFLPIWHTMWLFGYVCHWGILLYKIAGSLQPDSFEKHLLFANHSLFHFSFLGHLIRILLSRHAAAAVCRAAWSFNCIDSTGLPHYPLQPVLHSSALVPDLCFPVFGLVVESPPSPFLWNQRVVPLSFSDTGSGDEGPSFFWSGRHTFCTQLRTVCWHDSFAKDCILLAS